MLTPDRGEQFGPGKLWSLWDMLRIKAERYLHLGATFQDDVMLVWMASHEAGAGSDGIETITEDEANYVRAGLQKMLSLCEELGLAVSVELLKSKIEVIPATQAEMNMLWRSIVSELQQHLFLYVPQHRAKFYENDALLGDDARAAFPMANQELREAGNSFAAGLNTACVFHCMRALEHALRALAVDVGLKFDVQNWHVIIDQIEAKIRAEAATPKTAQRDEHLKFLSEAASEFRHFKDGWRNHVSHNKLSYEEAEAMKIMAHVVDFIEALSTRLSEPV